MDDELKIVLRSVLEADEQESAQRITSQLPNIERLVNGKSSIKIGVELASSDVKTQAQTVTKQMSSALAAHKVGVKLTPALDKESVGKLRSELESLKVDPKITSAVTSELDKMEIRIDRISGSWSKVADNQRALLNLTIQGTDAHKRSVTYLQTYNAETGEITTRLTNMVTDFERIRREEQQSAKAVDAKNAYLSKQRSLLKDIEASYSGNTSTRPVLDGAHLEELRKKYGLVEAAIAEAESASAKMSDTQKAHIESLVADLQRAVKEYQNVEYVATSLRTKTGIQVNAEEVKALDAYEESLRSAGILTDGFAKGIEGLRSKLSTAFDRESLNAYLNSFGKLKSAVELFEQQIAGADAVYDKLIKKNNEISALNKRMLGMDRSSEEYKSSTEKLDILKQERAVLLEQAAAYDRIKGYSSSAQEEERQREILLANIAIEQAKIKDLAAAINNEMGIMPSVIKNVEARFRQLSAPTAELKQRVESLNALMHAVSDAKNEEEKILAYQRLEDAIALCNREMSVLSNTQNIGLRDEKLTIALDKAKSDLATVNRQWSAFRSNANLKREFADLETGLNRVKNGADMSKWTAQFNAFKSQVKAAGLNVQSFGDTLKNNLKKVGQWLSATSIIFRVFGYLKQGLQTVVALDTALIDLRKTTDATEGEYEEFYKTANQTAKQLGATTEEIIAQTAEWSRLGYTLQEASELAKNSAIFSSISEDLDLEAATDGLVSIIKAFDVDVEDAMDGIISKVNAVGNAFAVTNSDIVEALTRSSSAMAAANNTFDETVSLATAAIEITRDASSVGNALKTISMRIRGYDQETEEYSEEVVALTGAIADLTKVASNNYSGVSLFEAGDPETYRSTYDILADIADIWEELTDKDQAQLLEALFGKRQAQIGAAMLSNFEQAEKSIKTMAESAGSAEAEMENIYNSLEYKLNRLKETWTGVAQDMFQGDDMKLVVDGFTKLSEAIKAVTGELGLLGTISASGGIATIVQLFKSAGRPKLTGFMIVPAYIPVVTRNELIA